LAFSAYIVCFSSLGYNELAAEPREPRPEKRDYRHVGIKGGPDDEKRTYQDIAWARSVTVNSA